jgi:hypothetical protein
MKCPYCGEDHKNIDCPILKDAARDVIQFQKDIYKGQKVSRKSLEREVDK